VTTTPPVFQRAPTESRKHAASPTSILVIGVLHMLDFGFACGHEKPPVVAIVDHLQERTARTRTGIFFFGATEIVISIFASIERAIGTVNFASFRSAFATTNACGDHGVSNRHCGRRCTRTPGPSAPGACGDDTVPDHWTGIRWGAVCRPVPIGKHWWHDGECSDIGAVPAWIHWIRDEIRRSCQ